MSDNNEHSLKGLKEKINETSEQHKGHKGQVTDKTVTKSSKKLKHSPALNHRSTKKLDNKKPTLSRTKNRPSVSSSEPVTSVVTDVEPVDTIRRESVRRSIAVDAQVKESAMSSVKKIKNQRKLESAVEVNRKVPKSPKTSDDVDVKVVSNTAETKVSPKSVSNNNTVEQNTKAHNHRTENPVRKKPKKYPVETYEFSEANAPENTRQQRANKKQAAVSESPKRGSFRKTTDTKRSQSRSIKTDVNEANSAMSNPNRADHGHKQTKYKERKRNQKAAPQKSSTQPKVEIRKVPKRIPLPTYKKIENIIEHLYKSIDKKTVVFDASNEDMLTQSIGLVRNRVSDNQKQIRLLESQIKNNRNKRIVAKYTDEISTLTKENTRLNTVVDDVNNLIEESKVRAAANASNAQSVSESLTKAVSDITNDIRETLNKQPKKLFTVKKTKFVTDKKVSDNFDLINSIRVRDLTQKQVVSLINKEPVKNMFGGISVKKSATLSYREVHNYLEMIRSNAHTQIDDAMVKEIKNVLDMGAVENMTPKQFLSKKKYLEGAAFERLSRKTQLAVLQQKMRQGGIPTEMFHGLIKNLTPEGQGFWKQVHFLMSNKKQNTHHKFVYDEAKEFMESYINHNHGIWSKPQNIRGSLRPFFENWISKETFDDDAARTQFYDELKLAKAKAKTYDLNDHEVDILRRSMNKRLNGKMSTKYLNSSLGRIAHMREMRDALYNMGDTKTAGSLSDLIDELSNAADEKTFRAVMNKAKKITKNLRQSNTGEIIETFAQSQATKGLNASKMRALRGVGVRVGLVAGVASALVNAAGYAFVGAMKLATKANTYLGTIQRQDFGAGRALTTQALSTTNGRARQIMMNNKYGARRWLGMEAQLYGK